MAAPSRSSRDIERSVPEPAFEPTPARRRPDGDTAPADRAPLRDPERLEARLRELPTGPGVYLFLDARRKPIYIGKAKSLRTRVRSYFRGRFDDGRLFYPFLVRRIADVDVVATENEKEALLLENHLIKRHQPRYNVKLADDKTYLSIRVTTDEAWPRVQLVRKQRKSGGVYFGPYDSASAVRATVKHIKRYFPLRTCSDADFRQRKRPCIEFDMGRCRAPCVGLEDEASYGRTVADVVLFLKGRADDLIQRMRADMLERSEALEYEEAARIRDRIAAIERTLQHQAIARPSLADRDVFGIALAPGVARVEMVQVRDGKVSQTLSWPLSLLEPEPEPEAESAAEPAPETGGGPTRAASVLNAFLGQLYADESRPAPREVVVPIAVADADALAEVLSERRGTKVRVVVPERGERTDLIRLAMRNAELALTRSEERKQAMTASLHALRDRVGLRRLPRSIECFDISNIQGAFAVGAMVRFEDGDPDKNRYRRFKIKRIGGADDFSMMREVLERRYTKASPGPGGKDPGAKRDPDLPDLVVVDGGKGQLGVATRVLAGLGLIDDVDVVGLAKARHGRNAVSKRGEDATALRELERVFLPDHDEPVPLPPTAAECHLLERVRDEAHRFAITYHRELRRRSAMRAGLDDVPGIGPKRRRALLRHFGNLKAIRAATVEELAAVPSMSRASADAVHAHVRLSDDERVAEETLLDAIDAARSEVAPEVAPEVEPEAERRPGA